MIIGIPREIKNNENRVAVTPAGAVAMVAAGHRVLLETGAGVGSGFADNAYAAAGATIVASAGEAWSAEMVVKVKEPLSSEYGYFRDDLQLFTYLHLAAEPELTRSLLERGVTSVAYETVRTDDGALPLLAPMSEIAGRMSVQLGAQFLEKPNGGKGILMGGVPGVPSAKVGIIGGGTVGINAARIALGMGAQVTVIDISADRLRYLDDLFQGRLQTLMSNSHNIAAVVASSDLLIGAVLVPGARAPQLVSEAMVKSMSPGSVIVDVAVDQGGSIATVDHVTTHSDPVYLRHGVLHYAVANIPGAVAHTSTLALTNMTMPYALQIAASGCLSAAGGSHALASGVNTVRGHLTCKPVADFLGYDYTPLDSLIS